MHLQTIDWAIIAGFFAVVLSIGLVALRTAGRDASGFIHVIGRPRGS